MITPWQEHDITGKIIDQLLKARDDGIITDEECDRQIDAAIKEQNSETDRNRKS